jgi:hypothetical protein
MGRFWCLGLLVLAVGGCVPIVRDPVRDEFGVSTARPDAGTNPVTADQQAKLDWKAQQICVRGYSQTKEGIEPAQVPQQIVATQEAKPVQAPQQMIDMRLLCGHYDRLDFDYVHMNWSNLL